jgi:DNA-binding transcriptional LysR family regulator
MVASSVVARPGDVLSELRVGDLKTFLAVRRSGSVSAAARELGVTPSQVSKAIARLESILRIRLFSRGARGVALSEQARLVMPHIEAVVARLHLMGRREGPSIAELTVAGPSFLIASFLPAVAACQAEVHVRGIELAPALVRAYAPENVFEMAILARSADRMPTTWVSVKVGEIRCGLFATPELARRLGSFPVAVDKLRSIPFVTPIYHAEGRYFPVDDDCPLSLAERKPGHSAQTVGLALELAARTNQLVFGPVVAARRFVTTDALVEVPVRGWSVTEPLYISCNADRMMAKVQTAVVKAMREASAEAS